MKEWIYILGRVRKENYLLSIQVESCKYSQVMNSLAWNEDWKHNEIA